MKPPPPYLLAACIALGSIGAGSLAAGQGPGYGFERGGTSRDDPALVTRDLTGRSVKCPRVRVIHSTDPSRAGTSGYFVFSDPWVGYARGRELFLREFSAADGVFGESGRPAGPVLDDGVTRMTSRDHVSGCGVCHNVPWRDAGAGATIAKNGGTGRNTPHLFGAGLVEMLGWQVRLDLLAAGDRDRNGFIGRAESRGVPAVVYNLPPGRAGRRPISFGRFGDSNGDGRPDLNSTLHILYVDREGRRIPWARSLRVPGVAGYTFEVQVFGFGQRGRLPVSSTLRGFAAQALDTHAGLQAHDPTLSEEPREDGLARVSLPGAPQFINAVPRDRGNVRGPGGISLDDPDRDGFVEEITEGDLDLLEWYQLNHPAPARAARTPEVTRGERLFSKIGCAGCHTPDWRLPAANPKAVDYTQRSLGDRRFFDLQVAPDARGELRGRIHLLADRLPADRLLADRLPAVRLLADRLPADRLLAVRLPADRLPPPCEGGLGGVSPGRLRRRFGAFTVRGVYSDFRSHDLGPACRQVQYDGSTITHFRTTPLWGVGSSAPYGHDGSALSLDAIIRKHGGEAAGVTRAYSALSGDGRRTVRDFLESLVLYSTDDLPTDLDGDGRIAPHFRVAGQDTGRERFCAEWLFNTPCRIEGPILAPDGRRIVSMAVTNLPAAYGTELPWVKDKDADGFPDTLGYIMPR